MKKLFLVLFFAGLLFSSYAQQKRVYSVFVYNFTRYITWPPTGGDFHIEVFGDDDMYNELSKVAKVKTVRGKKIIVKKINSINASLNPSILYVGSGKLNEVAAVTSKLRGGTLLVTDDQNDEASFKHINLKIQGGKPIYEIYEAEIDKTQLKVAPQLKSLGVIK